MLAKNYLYNLQLWNILQTFVTIIYWKIFVYFQYCSYDRLQFSFRKVAKNIVIQYVNSNLLFANFILISVGQYKWENGFITTVFDITLFLFFRIIYMKGTNKWYVAFQKLLEFYDLYLVITKKGTGRSHVMSRFSSRKNLIL